MHIQTENLCMISLHWGPDKSLWNGTDSTLFCHFLITNIMRHKLGTHRQHRIEMNMKQHGITMINGLMGTEQKRSNAQNAWSGWI